MSLGSIHRLRTVQTYLHKNVEVKTTGRVARKEKKTRRQAYEGSETTVVLLHEITPIDQEVGSWAAWVDLTELYKIETENGSGESID